MKKLSKLRRPKEYLVEVSLVIDAVDGAEAYDKVHEMCRNAGAMSWEIDRVKAEQG